MSNTIFIKQNIDIFFMTYVCNNIFIDGTFLISSLFTTTKEHISDFYPTNSQIIFPLTSSFILPITFLLTGSKSFEFSE